MVEKACVQAEIKAPDIVPDLNFAIINAKLLNSLICDILDYSLFKEKKLRLSIEEFYVVDAIKEVIDLISFQAVHKGVQINFDNECDLELLMNSDERRMKQVLINLLSNSLKFTSSGGEIKIRLSPSNVVPEVLIYEVTDSGCGMTDQVLQNLFKPFSTANIDGLNERGIGLGLIICKEIVNQMGPFNEIFVSSVRNSGSSFTFFLFQNLIETKLSQSIAFLSNESEFHRASENKNEKKSLPPEVMEALRAEVIPFEDVKQPQDLSIGETKNGLLKTKQKNFDLILTQESAISAAHLKNPFTLSSPSKGEKYKSPTRIKLVEFALKSEPCLESFGDMKMWQQVSLSQLSPPNSQMFRARRRPSHLKDESGGNIIVKTLNVLIVDDNMFNLIVLENLLRMLQNFKVFIFSAPDGDKALEIFEKKNVQRNDDSEIIHIILLDLNLPILSGYEVSRILTEKFSEGYKKCFVIACTSNNSKSEKKKCKKLGMDDFLEKPITVETINRLFDKYFL